MAKKQEPAVFNIPPHRAFADALVAGVRAQYGADPLTLARGVILLPNNRAVQAVRDAFVRQSEKGLLLPRLIPIGDADMEARLGAALDPLEVEPIPPAVEPLHRQLILARLLQQERAAARNPIDMAEAMRLAADLARTLDQLIIEEVDPKDLQTLEVGAELSQHWQDSLELLTVVLNQWPDELKRLGQIDLTDRRNRLLHQLAARWHKTPPKSFAIAAGISTNAPAVAALVRVIAHMDIGCVVLAGLDPHMSDAEWDDIAGNEKERAIETHPQFHLRQLLDRMKVPRGLVIPWQWGEDAQATAVQRSKVMSLAMQPPEYSTSWHELPAKALQLGDVHALQCPTPAHEANVIALRMREALEVPGQTAALVTPDRDLARRVVALLARWEIAVNDSAGQPLSQTGIGSLIIALIDAVTHDFAPVPLLTLLKSPLVNGRGERFPWLDGVRALDLALRGPRPAAGLQGLSAFLAHGDERTKATRTRAAAWWQEVAPLLVPAEKLIGSPCASLPEVLEALRGVLDALGGDELWSGAAGHAAATLFEDLERLGGSGPQDISFAALGNTMRALMDAVAVRPAAALHPRLFIWGLLEAKLQTADVVILGGLNEGVWPALPAPDPWLAPRVRHELGLPTLEHRIGREAHDLVGAMGAKQVLLTRAARDTRAPAIASRFWLRLQALTGELPTPKLDYRALAEQLDPAPDKLQRAKRPAPLVEHRPKEIQVTAVDTLKADPFAFYAQYILKLRALDPVDADPSDAWRGTLIHAALQRWAEDEGYASDKITGCFASAFAEAHVHSLLTTLWMPRFEQAGQFIAQRTAEARTEGRMPFGVEVKGKLLLHGVTVVGRLDRLDKSPDGLAVIDYKTGAPPSTKQIKEGFRLQLGLIGIMAQGGAFEGMQGEPIAFEYWSLGRENGKPYGYVKRALAKDQSPQDFLATTEAHYREAVEKWLIGDAPFKAKLRPDYGYATYDHLMRYDEWAGRDD